MYDSITLINPIYVYINTDYHKVNYIFTDMDNINSNIILENNIITCKNVYVQLLEGEQEEIKLCEQVNNIIVPLANVAGMEVY